MLFPPRRLLRNGSRRVFISDIIWPMTITLPLEPKKEAQLVALAKQRGVSADELVREAIDKMLEAAPDPIAKPKKSAFGLLERYGPGPTEEEIDENRREMFRGFAEDRL